MTAALARKTPLTGVARRRDSSRAGWLGRARRYAPPVVSREPEAFYDKHAASQVTVGRA